MEIAAPQLLRESAASADPVRMTRDEEIADASFRAADFASLDREHLSVQGCLFTGCLFAGRQHCCLYTILLGGGLSR